MSRLLTPPYFAHKQFLQHIRGLSPSDDVRIIPLADSTLKLKGCAYGESFQQQT